MMEIKGGGRYEYLFAILMFGRHDVAMNINAISIFSKGTDEAI